MNQNNEKISPHEEELLVEIKKLSKKIKKINSKRRIFFNGIISGVAKGFGATIVFGIIITIISFIIKITDSSWLLEIIKLLHLESHISSYQNIYSDIFSTLFF